MARYEITSIKFSRTIDADSDDDAIAQARALDEEYQPAFGTTVEAEPRSGHVAPRLVAEIRDGEEGEIEIVEDPDRTTDEPTHA
jgi:hypothetical protein